MPGPAAPGPCGGAPLRDPPGESCRPRSSQHNPATRRGEPPASSFCVGASPRVSPQPPQPGPWGWRAPSAAPAPAVDSQGGGGVGGARPGLPTGSARGAAPPHRSRRAKGSRSPPPRSRPRGAQVAAAALRGLAPSKVPLLGVGRPRPGGFIGARRAASTLHKRSFVWGVLNSLLICRNTDARCLQRPGKQEPTPAPAAGREAGTAPESPPSGPPRLTGAAPVCPRRCPQSRTEGRGCSLPARAAAAAASTAAPRVGRAHGPAPPRPGTSGREQRGSPSTGRGAAPGDVPTAPRGNAGSGRGTEGVTQGWSLPRARARARGRARRRV